MSDYESHSGKLRIVEAKENENFEQLCKRLWIEESKNDDEFSEEFIESSLFDDFYKKYVDVNGNVWEIVEHIELGEEEDMFCKLHDNKDGTFSFHTRFYNGGTCMSEMVTEALEKLELE